MRFLNRGLLAASALIYVTFAAEVTDATGSSLSGTTTRSANIGDYIAAGLDLVKVDTDNPASTNSYTFSNATSTTSLRSLTTGGAASLSTSYANNTLKSANTATRSSSATLLSLATSETSSDFHKSSDEAFNSTLLVQATAGLSLNSTTPPHAAATTASLLSVGMVGTGSLNTPHTNSTSRSINTVTVTSTSRITSCGPSSTDSRGVVWDDCKTETSLVTKTFTNTTWTSATDADDCWTDWVSYWSMHKPMPATVDVVTKLLPATTVTKTASIYFVSTLDPPTITTTIFSTAPTEAVNGGFTTTMAPVVVTYVTVLTSSYTTFSTSLYSLVETPQTYDFPTISASNDPDWPPPSCTVPAMYPDCQSQWEEYATHNAALGPQVTPGICEFDYKNLSQPAPACYKDAQASWNSWSAYVKEATSPICSQASITGAICTSLKDMYVLGYNTNFRPQNPGYVSVSSGFYSVVAPHYTGWTWPASQQFAPGCSLGCGRCAITGGSIELLYFPPGMTPHPATGPVVATTLGTVLTSPTYYISFASIYASDACSGVGSTLTSLILPIPTDQPLSTLFGSTSSCRPNLLLRPWLPRYRIGTAPMNVTDLMHEPVPYSIYTSQPYCASHIAESGCVASACPTTLPYRPLIVLSSQLLNSLDPAWGGCSLDLRGLYDPPKALQPATAVVVPTMASPSPKTSATPADPPAEVTPEPTALPEQDDPTPSQAPANPPEPTSPSAEAPKTTPNDPPPVAGQTSDEPTSPSAEAPKPTRNDPPPVAGQSPDDSLTPASPSADVSKTTLDAPPPQTSQRTSADPAGAIISLVVGLTSQSPATNAEETAVSGGTVVQPPAAQNPAKPPAETSGSPADSQNNPVSPDGAPVAVTGGADQDASQPAASKGAGAQPVNNGPTVISVGSQLITATPGRPLVVAGTTLAPNAPIEVDGHTLSSGSAGLVVDGTSVIALPSSGGQVPAAEFTIGSQTFTASAADAASPSAIVVAGTTLSRGGPAATIGGAVVSAGSAGLVIDGKQTVQLPADGSVPTAAVSQAIFAVGSSTITAILATGSDNAIVLDGTTLSAGGSAITVDGSQISAGPAGVVVGGSQTVFISEFEAVPTAAATSQAVLTLGDSTITATAASGTGSAILIDGTTLSPGGPAITVHGTKLSAGPSGIVVDGTQTVQFSALKPAQTPTDALQTVLTLGNSTITAFLPTGSGNAIIVNGTILSLGGSAITVDGTELSAGTSGIVIDGMQTIQLSALESAPTPNDALQTVLTLGDSTITAFLPTGSGDAIIVDGTTLSPGGSAITIDGTELSAGTAGLVVGSTRTVSPKTTTGGSQAMEESGTAASNAPTATDPSSTSDSAQSGGGHVFRFEGKWLSVLFGLSISLAIT